MRRLSVNARLAIDAQGSAEVEVMLAIIRHPALDAPVRLSSDPTSRISVDPLRYGTYSSWQTDDGEPFLFIPISVLLPDDQEDATATASIVLELVDNSIAEALRSTFRLAAVDLAVVTASTPDLLETEVRGLELVSVDGDTGQVTLSLARKSFTDEPWPAGRMTRDRFPALMK